MTLTEYSPLLWILLAVLLWRAGKFSRPALWMPPLAGWMASLLGAPLFRQNVFAAAGLCAGILLSRIFQPGCTGVVQTGDLALVIRPFDRQNGGQIRCRGRIFPARSLDLPRKAGEIVEITGEDGVFYLCQ